jgi:hypothetical protein
VSGWSDQVRSQARLLVGQIGVLNSRFDAMGIEDRSALDEYFEMLERLFDKDFQIAQTRDNSDLVFRVDGDAFRNSPRLQLVTSVFDNVTTQVTGLTKAILGLGSYGQITSSSVDLGLSGLAKGSLIFGLKAQMPNENDHKGMLLGELDTLFTSTKKALEVIDEVAHTVYRDTENVSMEAVSEVVEDPRVRDAALVAVQRISPSGRRGIESVFLSSHNNRRRPAELTSENRKSIRDSLVRPVIMGEQIQLIGSVREIDLDSRRFDLRGIADEKIRDVRCAYRQVSNVNPRHLLGSMVKVRGLVERSQDGVPRLMSVTELEILKDAPSEP